MDDPDTIMRKFKRAVTDSEGYVSYRDEQPGVKNLIEIYCACTGKTPDEAVKEFEGKGYGELKPAVAESVISVLKPLQDEFARLSRIRHILIPLSKKMQKRLIILLPKLCARFRGKLVFRTGSGKKKGKRNSGI